MTAVNNNCEVAPWIRLLGIVGGLGPLAHIHLESNLVRAVMDRYERLRQPLCDQSYPPWVVASIPQTPDRTSALLNHDSASPVPCLLSALDTLRRCGCDFALIACNTTHAWINETKKASPLPILDAVQATIEQQIRLFGAGTLVGVLATDGTLKSGIYPPDGSIRFISPLNLESAQQMQETVMKCIYGSIDDKTGARIIGIKSGIHLDDAEAREAIERQLCLVVEQLLDRGARAIVLGCTELPLVLNEKVVQRWLPNRVVHLIDPMDVAARIAIQIAAGEEPLPS